MRRVGSRWEICENDSVARLHHSRLSQKASSYVNPAAARDGRFFSRDLPTFSRIPHTRSRARTRARITLVRVDPRPRRQHARTGQGQARSRPTYRTDRRPALNFIHTHREVDSRVAYLRGIQNDVPMDQTAAIRRRRSPK